MFQKASILESLKVDIVWLKGLMGSACTFKVRGFHTCINDFMKIVHLQSYVVTYFHTDENGTEVDICFVRKFTPHEQTSRIKAIVKTEKVILECECLFGIIYSSKKKKKKSDSLKLVYHCCCC